MSSRRESRDSESKRDRSRFDRESSPKRSRRDGKPEEELGGTDTDEKPRQTLRDAVPLEPDTQGLRKDGEKKHSETTKQAPHLSEGLRSRPYHQHDVRRTTGMDDRRPTSERGSWRSSRDQINRRAGDDEKPRHLRDEDKSTWRHDRFHESDDTKGALSRKRPAFREKKIPEESRIDSGRTKEEENYDGETRMSMDQAQGGGDGTPLLFGEQGDEAKKDAKQSLENQDGSKVLPFEFVALEACLEAASSSLESEAVRLELEAHPALDKLTSKISTLNLERVRQIKSRLVAITGRVQKVRDELEHLLDDDEDMAEMYLTEKLAQKLENSSASSMNESDTVEVDLPEGDEDDRLPAESASESNRDESYLRANDDAHDLLMSTHSALSRNSRGTHTSSTRSALTNKFDVEELEMLLEAYFVQIDGTLNKLSTLREYVDDTEDYINIMLDDKQNHLLQMGVMLTTATLVMSAFIAVAGVFGMNITIELFKDEKAGPTRFAWTVIGGFIGSIFLYVGAIGWWKQKRLLE